MTCLLCDEIDAVRERTCVGKSTFGPKHAHVRADQVTRTTGETVRPYLCNFDHPGLYHVGRPLSWESVERLAVLLRHRQFPNHGDAA
jgi:hypothetical protein